MKTTIITVFFLGYIFSLIGFILAVTFTTEIPEDTEDKR